ncbi:MAG: hypothetical protein ACI86M_000820 [Saprospiraceae bacterium]|jgi:hypothetical protein
MEITYAPSSDRWGWRSTDLSIGIQYWYQVVNVMDLASNDECAGNIGSSIFKNAGPSPKPINAYAETVSGSVHPQESFALPK